MEPVSPTPQRPRVAAVVPVLNEADAIGGVVAGLISNGVDLVVVVDGKSTDSTAAKAYMAGAKVLVEPHRGYGRALMTGIEGLPANIDIVLFFDGDGTDRTDLVPSVLAPIIDGRADFSMGSRLHGEREPGSLGAAQVVAGHLAGLLIRLFYGVRFTDMSPFRALRRDTLVALAMQEATFGWNLEMQMRVAALGLRIVEIPVGQRNRQGGVSKVSGDLRSALRAAWIIGQTFFRLARSLPRAQRLRDSSN
jgi:glycosyltransferase involved in cell wall biosynthesis